MPQNSMTLFYGQPLILKYPFIGCVCLLPCSLSLGACLVTNVSGLSRPKAQMTYCSVPGVYGLSAGESPVQREYVWITWTLSPPRVTFAIIIFPRNNFFS